MAFKYAKLAGINQGVTAIITVMATIFNSISFYLAFGEVPSCVKFLGMFFCFGTTIFQGLNGIVLEESPSQIDLSTDQSSRTKYTFFSIGYSLLVPFGFSLKHFIIRKYKGSYRTVDLLADSNNLENICFCIMMFP